MLYIQAGRYGHFHSTIVKLFYFIFSPRKSISKRVLVTVVAVAVAVACALLISSIPTLMIKKRHEKYKQTSSRKSLRKFLIWLGVLKSDYSHF